MGKYKIVEQLAFPTPAKRRIYAVTILELDELTNEGQCKLYPVGFEFGLKQIRSWVCRYQQKTGKKFRVMKLDGGAVGIWLVK